MDIEWSERVARGIIECLRGPHQHWAAGRGGKWCGRENEGVKPVRETVGDLVERSGKYLQGELLIVSQVC